MLRPPPGTTPIREPGEIVVVRQIVEALWRSICSIARQMLHEFLQQAHFLVAKKRSRPSTARTRRSAHRPDERKDRERVDPRASMAGSSATAAMAKVVEVCDRISRTAWRHGSAVRPRLEDCRRCILEKSGTAPAEAIGVMRRHRRRRADPRERNSPTSAATRHASENNTRAPASAR